MAYPGDPSGRASRAAAAFAAARLTPDDFERLAAAFHPSWELDEAPFTGASSMTPSELNALQGGEGTHADLRVTAPLTNGAHGHLGHAAAAAGAQGPQRPQGFAIVDRTFSVADIPPPAMAPAPTPAPTPFGPPVVEAPPPSVVVAPPAPAVVFAPPTPAVVVAPPTPAVVVAPPSFERLAQTRIVRRPVPAPTPLPQESTGSFDMVRRSKRPLWIAVGVGVIALAAVGIWSTSGGSDATIPPVPKAIATTAPTRALDVPPPPEATPAPVAPAPRTIAVSALAQVPMPVQTTVAPSVRPAAAPASPPAAQPRPAVTPKPARPKGGGAGTIVHDVPF